MSAPPPGVAAGASAETAAPQKSRRTIWVIVAVCAVVLAAAVVVLVLFLPGGKHAYMAVVKVQGARVLSEPKMDGTVVAELAVGRELTVMGKTKSENEEWLQVEVPMKENGQESTVPGYIPAPDVEPVVEAVGLEKIVFARDGNVWIMNTDGSGQKQLTSSGWDDNPTISPDGTMIAFQSARDHVPRPGDAPSWDPYLSQIYIMRPDGSDQRRLTEESGEECANPSFFPDSRSVAFQTVVYDRDPYSSEITTSLKSVMISNKKLNVIAKSDTTPDEFTYCLPVVSRDGGTIISNLLGSQEAAGWLKVTNVKDGVTSDLQFAVPSAGKYEYGSFLPALTWNGGLISMCMDAYGEDPQLGLATPDGKNITLRNMPELEIYSDGQGGFNTGYFKTSWTRNNKLIISGAGYNEGFGTLGHGSEGNIYMMNPSGDLEGLIAERGVAASCGAIKTEYAVASAREKPKKKGRKGSFNIAFVRNGDVWVGDFDGQKIAREQPLTTDKNNHDPCWSPDGNKIVFGHWTSVTTNYVQYNGTLEEVSLNGKRKVIVDGSNPTAIGLSDFRDTVAFGNPRYTPDGDAIYLQMLPLPPTGGAILCRYGVSSGKITSMGMQCYDFDISSKGQFLFSIRDRDKPGVVEALILCSQPSIATRSLYIQDRENGHFNSDGNRFVCLNLDNNPDAGIPVSKYDLSGHMTGTSSVPKEVEDSFGGWPNWTISFTPDDKDLLVYANAYAEMTNPAVYLLNFDAGKCSPVIDNGREVAVKPD